MTSRPSGALQDHLGLTVVDLEEGQRAETSSGSIRGKLHMELGVWDAFLLLFDSSPPTGPRSVHVVGLDLQSLHNDGVLGVWCFQ